MLAVQTFTFTGFIFLISHLPESAFTNSFPIKKSFRWLQIYSLCKNKSSMFLRYKITSGISHARLQIYTILKPLPHGSLWGIGFRYLQIYTILKRVAQFMCTGKSFRYLQIYTILKQHLVQDLYCTALDTYKFTLFSNLIPISLFR